MATNSSFNKSIISQALYLFIFGGIACIFLPARIIRPDNLPLIKNIFLLYMYSAVILGIILFYYKSKNRNKSIFCICFSLILIGCFLFSNFYLTRHTDLTKGYSNIFDYADLFISVVNDSSSSSIYPPLATNIYSLLCKLIPSNITTTVESLAYTPEGNYLLMLFFLFSTIPLCLLCFYCYNGSTLEKILFSSAIMLSGPIIFSIQRGNIILLALELTMFYCFTYNSKNKVLSELSLFALAFAAAIKIYPAIFGILLLKEKKWKQAIHCILYGLFLFIIPVFFLEDGFSYFPKALKNLNSYSAEISNTITYSLKSIIWFFYSKFSANTKLFSIISYICIAIYTGFSFLIIFISKKEWIVTTICALLAMMLPSISCAYSSIFLLIPIICLMNNEIKDSIDYIALIFFMCIFVYCRFNINLTSLRVLTQVGIWITPILLFLLCIANTVKEIIYHQKKQSKRKI